MELKVKIKKLRPEAVMPAYATDASAACDLCACIAEPVTLMPGERAKLPTGIAIAPERSDTCRARFPAAAAWAVKHGITLSNSVGVVDADYPRRDNRLGRKYAAARRIPFGRATA